MGKVGGSSWLAAVKRAFRSPTKDNNKKTSRRREDHDQEDEEKKRGKRRWIFRKPSMQETVIQHSAEKIITTSSTNTTVTATAISEATDAKQRHALAVAMATTAAAQAAVATAQAAVEVARLTRPTLFAKKHFAAIAIQTAFRGYLARRALRALKGLVKLQALVRGHNVRKRAKITLHCMQALMRVQARVRDQRNRLSHEGNANSTLSDPNSLCGSHFADRKSIPRDENNTTDEWVHWDENAHSLEEIQVLLQETKEEEEEVALKREKALAHAFSRQIWMPSRDTYASEGELEEKPRWHDQWTRRKQLENRGRTLCDQRESIIKTVEVDTYSTPYTHKPHHYHLYQQQRPSSFSATSPLPRHQNNITPSPSKATRQLQVYSASPRYLREDRNNISKTGNGIASSMPNYMAATASATARLRSQSAPRQRASTPEREKIGPTAKKRLSFPNPVTSNSSSSNNNIVDYRLKSPSYKQGIHEAHLGMEHRSTVSSCYTESSIGDEASPLSTNELNRWLR